MAQQVVAAPAARPEGDGSKSVVEMASRLPIGVEGLVCARDAARGAVRRVDHACRTELMASVRRSLVVGKQVVVAKGCSTVLRSAAGMNQDRLSGLVGTVRGHLTKGRATAGTDAAFLLFRGLDGTPREIGVDPVAVVVLRSAAGGGVGDGEGRVDGRAAADPRVGIREAESGNCGALLILLVRRRVSCEACGGGRIVGGSCRAGGGGGAEAATGGSLGDPAGRAAAAGAEAATGGS